MEQRVPVRTPFDRNRRPRRYDCPDPATTAHAVIAHDQREALVSFAQIATSDSLATGVLRITGLAFDQRYRVALLNLGERRAWGMASGQPPWVDAAIELTGGQLAAGLQMPILQPESAIILHIVVASR